MTNRVRFFEKTFLVDNISPEVVLRIPFLILSSANIDFLDRKLWWRTYTIIKALPTTRRIDLVGKKEFVVVALNLEHETYVIHIGSVNSIVLPGSSPLKLDVHSSHRS